MPTYGRSKCFDYTMMRSGYDNAARRAAQMEQRRAEERNPWGNPFTNVYKLTRLIKENGR